MEDKKDVIKQGVKEASNKRITGGVNEDWSASEQEQEKKPELDPKISKELEELRQYKAKVEGDKKKEVKVSDSFFGREKSVIKQEQKKRSTYWEEMLGLNVPYNEGWDKS